MMNALHLCTGLRKNPLTQELEHEEHTCMHLIRQARAKKKKSTLHALSLLQYSPVRKTDLMKY